MLRFALSVLVALVSAIFAVGCGGADRGGPGPSVSDAGRERALAAYAGLPLMFVENRGQADKRVRFHAQSAGHAVYLTRDEIALTLQKDSGKGVALALRFLGADPGARPSGDKRVPGTANYLMGDDPSQWRTQVPGYSGVVYRDLWPGIDLKLRGQAEAIKYEFRVRPGARVADIQLAYRGATGLRRDTEGALQIETALGDLRDSPPVTYQEIGGVRTPVRSRYVLSGERGYGFAVGDYERGRDLIIDPSLSYSTLLGGSSHEFGSGIQVDASGNAYVTGFTQSPNFPTTTGAFDRTGSASNNLDAFVSKLNPAGTALVYSTFLGGSNSEWGRDIAVDSTGSAYVTGKTMSSGFPTTAGAFDRSFNVDSCPRCGIDQVDAFITKLNPAGSGLVYSTFLGGTSPDETFGIAIDGARNAYVTGETTGNFPTTAGAFDTTAGGGSDAYVAKLNAAGSALVYATRLGGADNELPEDLAVDASGNATVGGSTRSADFPTTPGAFDTTQNGGAFDERFDLFVTKLNAAGSGLAYSTFVGGSKSDFGDDLALDGAGNAYMVGGTLSPDFPTTPGTFDPAFANGSKGFVFKLNPAGSRLVYSTFLGEAGASAVAPDANGNAWLAGASGQNGTTTADAFDRFFNGGVVDAYVAKLNATGSALTFASFLGGSESEGGNDVALDAGGNNVYVTGHTYSADFTTTAGAFDRTFAGDTTIFWGDAFVARVDVNGTSPTQPPPPPPPAAPALVSPAAGAVTAPPVTFDWTDVTGAASYTIQVDEISEFGAPLILSASAGSSQFTAGSLPDGNWFWRVRAVNSAGTPGAWSAVRTIQVQSTPPPPPPPTPGTASLVSPANGAQVTQPFRFDWSDVAAAAWYTIEVDDGSSFASPLVFAATTTPSELTVSSLPNGALFWRVRAFNSDGVGGPFSAVRSVQVQSSAPPPPPPGALPSPSLLSPANDARLRPGQQAVFDWSDVAGAATYTIQIDDSSSFSAPLIVDKTLAFSQLTTSSLPTRRMWWRVRANDGSGASGAWSAARRFEVKD